MLWQPIVAAHCFPCRLSTCWCSGRHRTTLFGSKDRIFTSTIHQLANYGKWKLWCHRRDHAAVQKHSRTFVSSLPGETVGSISRDRVDFPFPEEVRALRLYESNWRWSWSYCNFLQAVETPELEILWWSDNGQRRNSLRSELPPSGKSCIFYCPSVTGVGIAAFAISCRKLQLFLIKAIKNVGDDTVIPVVSKNPDINCIFLFGTEITDASLVAIVKSCRKLRIMTLINCPGLTKLGLKSLCHIGGSRYSILYSMTLKAGSHQLTLSGKKWTTLLNAVVRNMCK